MDLVRIALPSGKIQRNVFELLSDAGIAVSVSERSYRPQISLDGFEAKIVKPQNIVEMLDLGMRDVGFVGFDWVLEFDADVTQILDTGLDPVRIVAASTDENLLAFKARTSRAVVATEYTSLATRWLRQNSISGRVIRSFGTTEAFPPEDADCIIDNTSTGATLTACGLSIIDIVTPSSTRLCASPRALEIPSIRDRIESLSLLLCSVLEARQRVMIEVNVTSDNLERVACALPCMKAPTVSELYSGAGFVIKAAVLRSELPRIIPEIKLRGGTDLVVTSLSNVVP